MRQNDPVLVEGAPAPAPSFAQRRAIVQAPSCPRADCAARGEAEMADDDVGARLRHRLGIFGAKDIRYRQHVLGMGQGDHLDLERIGHAGLLEIGTKQAVDEPDGREILHARKAQTLQFIEKGIEQAERVGPVDAGKHWRLLHDRQHLMRHLPNDFIGVTVGQHARERTTASHAIAARIIDDDQVDAAGLLAFRRQARPRAATDDRHAGAFHRLQPGEDRLALKSGHQALLARRGFIAENASTTASTNLESLMLASIRSILRRPVWRTVRSRASNNALSASGSQKAWPTASSIETPLSGSSNRTGPSI